MIKRHKKNLAILLSVAVLSLAGAFFVATSPNLGDSTQSPSFSAESTIPAIMYHQIPPVFHL